LNAEVIKTGVDELLELLKTVSKISIADAALKLGVSPALVQSWVDFLVEEEIVGVEYKFTKPLIYLNKAPAQAAFSDLQEPEPSFQNFKEEYWKRALDKNIPEERIDFFWKNHLKEVAESRKDFFMREANRRRLENVEELWNSYVTALLGY
jgi:predicted ArsR family transcriptional regulator